MKSKKRKVIIHRVAKTEVKNYITPEKTIFKDVHITLSNPEYNWLTQPITYPRWAILLVIIMVFISGIIS